MLANFTDSFAQRLTDKTGIQFPKQNPEWPDEWHWERTALKKHGYSDAETSTILSDLWNDIEEEQTFWLNLDPQDGAREVLGTLQELRLHGHQIYFVTSRPGDWAKSASEAWLRLNGYLLPTVLISFDKGVIAAGLKLDVMVDDRPENLMEVGKARPECKLFLHDWPYNRGIFAPVGVTVTRYYDPTEPVQWVWEQQ